MSITLTNISLKKRQLLAGLVFFICLVSSNYAQNIFQTDFENSEGYIPGYFNDQQGWNASGLVGLDNMLPFSGAQLVWLPQDPSNTGNQISRNFNVVSNDNIVYVDFYMSPNAATALQDLPDISNLSTAALSGLAKTRSDTGEWAVVYGDGFGGGVWLPTGSFIDLNENAVSRYLWYVYKLDYDYKTYDFFLNGVLIAGDVPFIDSSLTSFDHFKIDTDGKQDVYFDNFTVSYDMPLALDHDKDGLLTTTEDIDGDGVVDPGETDFMSSDTDGDSMGDAIEWMHEFDPLTPGTYGIPLNNGSGILVWETDFELTEGFLPGNLNEQLLWQADGSVEVTDAAAAEGTQSVRLISDTLTAESTAQHYFGTDGMDQVWIHFYGKLSPGSLPSAIDMDARAAGIFKLNETGNLAAFDSYNREWLVEETLFDAGFFNDGSWKHFVVHLDYLNRQWTLIAEGGIVFKDIKFNKKTAPEFSYFKARQLKADVLGQSAYVDKLVVSDTEPEELDFDFDGILNQDERDTFLLLGLNEYKSDSDGDGISDGLEDFDSDGNENAFEFAAGRLPDFVDADVSLYADSALGDDYNYSGLSAVPGRPTLTDGPKASIASTFSEATDSDVILLQSGIYDETTLSPNGKNLTLRIYGPVTIR